MDGHSILHGACACDRNQYEIVVQKSSSPVQVFFDNSAANRRSQASPVTAWLRVPLDSFHSTTYAFLPHEDPNSIKKSFYTPSSSVQRPATRRQFCGYCGTHLTAFEDSEADFINVTLGSLLQDSLEQLEALDLLPTSDDEDAEETDRSASQIARTAEPQNTMARHKMQYRGIPYFESMVEDSRLGKIKHQKGSHRSQDGHTTVQWEVTEFEGTDEPMQENVEPMSAGKRRKLGSAVGQ